MIIGRRLLLIFCGFILVVGLTLWPERWSRPASAAVTLVRFTATSTPGQREISIDWETATEFGTSGFYVARSSSAAGPFARVSGFIVAEGSNVVGAPYHFPDTTTVFNHIYYYRLEVVNNDQSIDYHGPISAIAGPATNTPTPTPSPSATPTAPSMAVDVDPTQSFNSRLVITPRVALGETITPRPTSSLSSSPGQVAYTAAPTVSTIPSGSLPPGSAAAVAPTVPGVATATFVAPPPPTAANVAQAPAAQLAPTAEAPAMVEPVVIAPATAPRTGLTNATDNGGPILIAAAILFLGMALLILRQARQ